MSTYCISWWHEGVSSISKQRREHAMLCCLLLGGFEAPSGDNMQTYTVSACFHDTISLSCGPESRILVLEDFYGGPAVYGAAGGVGGAGSSHAVDIAGDSQGSPCRHAAGHCVVPAPADRDLSLVRRYCNGRQTCSNLQVQRRLCNSHRTNYQQVVYTCVPGK